MSLMLAILLAGQQAAATPAQTPPLPCTEPEYRAFDFWVGEWQVSQAGKPDVIAHSRIEKVSSGCAISESWMPLQGGGGRSLSAYDPATGTWEQMWIGSSPGRTIFAGGPIDGGMVLTGYWGKDKDGNSQLVRMTLTRREDGSVRQYGQRSLDHGVSWADYFDLIYRPARVTSAS